MLARLCRSGGPMTWAKLDDALHDSTAYNGLSAHALALWTRMQSRMAAQLSDGVLTTDDFDRLDLSRPKDERSVQPWPGIVSELVERGHLVPDGDDRWLDPGWLTRNPSKTEVELQRRWDVLRQQIRFAKDDETRKQLRDIEAQVKGDLYAARSSRKGGHSLVKSQVNSLSPVPSRPKGRGRDAAPTDAGASSGARVDMCTDCNRELPVAGYIDGDTSLPLCAKCLKKTLKVAE